MMKKILKISGVIILLMMLSCLEEDNGDLIDDRDAFLGAWKVSESCQKDSYTVQVVKDPSNSAQVLINNFWNTGNCGNPIYGIVAGNSVYLPLQTFCNGEFKGDGSGSLSKETISWTYSVNDGADLFNCEATYTRP